MSNHPILVNPYIDLSEYRDPSVGSGKLDDAYITIHRMHSDKDFVHPDDRALIEFINPNFEKGPWIAGGACLNWYQGKNAAGADIDIFCRDKEQLAQVKEKLMSLSFTRQKDINVHGTTNYDIRTYPHLESMDYVQMREIQVIEFKFFDSAKALIDNFDFSVVQIATDGNSIVLGDHTAHDIKHKILRIGGHAGHPSIIKRVVKYVSYGYRPAPGLFDSIKESPNTKWLYKDIEPYDYDNQLGPTT